MSVAENESFREIVKTFKIINEEHPKIQFDVHSGDAMDVIDRLDQGTIDVELLVGTPSLEKYNTLKLLMDELPSYQVDRGTVQTPPLEVLFLLSK